MLRTLVSGHLLFEIKNCSMFYSTEMSMIFFYFDARIFPILIQSDNGRTPSILQPCLVFISVDGGFTDWSSWGSCTQSCGGGTQQRTRACTNPAPQHGGSDCVGDTTEEQACGTSTCSGIYIYEFLYSFCNISILVFWISIYFVYWLIYFSCSCMCVRSEFFGVF